MPYSRGLAGIPSALQHSPIVLQTPEPTVSTTILMQMQHLLEQNKLNFIGKQLFIVRIHSFIDVNKKYLSTYPTHLQLLAGTVRSVGELIPGLELEQDPATVQEPFPILIVARNVQASSPRQDPAPTVPAENVGTSVT